MFAQLLSSRLRSSSVLCSTRLFCSHLVHLSQTEESKHQQKTRSIRIVPKGTKSNAKRDIAWTKVADTILTNCSMRICSSYLGDARHPLILALSNQRTTEFLKLAHMKALSSLFVFSAVPALLQDRQPLANRKKEKYVNALHE